MHGGPMRPLRLAGGREEMIASHRTRRTWPQIRLTHLFAQSETVINDLSYLL
jgi:hypothetical protein